MPLGGAIVGFSIAAMFYVGTMGIEFSASKHWDSLYVAISLLLGASFGAAALARGHLSQDIRGRLISSALLSAGIMSTCLVGLSALHLTPDPSIVVANDTTLPVLFGISLTAVIMLICSLGIVGALVDRYVAQIESAKHDLERTSAGLARALNTAEDANRAKSEFLATMSHELRTPLNAVIGFSEMMVDEVFGALGHQNYKDYAQDIHDSGSHLLNIINDILDITKAEAGSAILDESLVNCRELIVESCRLLRPRLQKSGLALVLSVPNSLPRLQADPRVVKQIILNLLTNAVKFTPPGGRIEVEVAADPHRGLVIAIRDTGIGIAKADLQRVRQPFVQVESSLSRRHEGTGLGLPLVEMMMRQHGGVFELDSEQDKGTTARVLFPAERLVWSGARQDDAVAGANSADARQNNPDEPAAPRTAKPAEFSHTPRILVVEDDRDLCDLLRRVLERAGFVTAGVSNGREALQHIMTEPTDLIVTDIVMPEMDGVELMRVLQKERPNLPVIALSGGEDIMEYSRIAGRLGARVALRKPVVHADLICAVNEVVGRRLSGDARAMLAASA
jgi:signal transduction histidine kinase/ActR/RegA family two-component response regulator